MEAFNCSAFYSFNLESEVIKIINKRNKGTARLTSFRFFGGTIKESCWSDLDSSACIIVDDIWTSWLTWKKKKKKYISKCKMHKNTNNESNEDNRQPIQSGFLHYSKWRKRERTIDHTKKKKKTISNARARDTYTHCLHVLKARRLSQLHQSKFSEKKTSSNGVCT